MRTLTLSIFSLLLLVSCASTPEFDLTGVNVSATPRSAVAEMDTIKGQSVVWGGVIISSQNLKDATQLEVLAYPLDSSHMPLLSKEPLGRFIVLNRGYLETTIFEAGRMISVLGVIDGSQQGKVGEADYVYPIVNARQLHLWSRDAGRSRTTFHFGLGVQL